MTLSVLCSLMISSFPFDTWWEEGEGGDFQLLIVLLLVFFNGSEFFFVCWFNWLEIIIYQSTWGEYEGFFFDWQTGRRVGGRVGGSWLVVEQGVFTGWYHRGSFLNSNSKRVVQWPLFVVVVVATVFYSIGYCVVSK